MVTGGAGLEGGENGAEFVGAGGTGPSRTGREGKWQERPEREDINHARVVFN